MTKKPAQKTAAKKAQLSPQTLWERTKGVATQIIEDEQQKQLAKTATLKEARLKKEAAKTAADAKAAKAAKSAKAAKPAKAAKAKKPATRAKQKT